MRSAAGEGKKARAAAKTIEGTLDMEQARKEARMARKEEQESKIDAKRALTEERLAGVKAVSNF